MSHSIVSTFSTSAPAVMVRGAINHRDVIVALLNERLGDAINLQCQCHRAHLGVTVPSSIAIHELFDEVHGAVLAYADLLAERVTQLGGVVESTICGAQVRAMFGENSIATQRGGDRHVALADVLRHFGRSTRRATAAMEMLGDAVSVGLLAEIASGIEEWQRLVEEQRWLGRISIGAVLSQ